MSLSTDGAPTLPPMTLKVSDMSWRIAFIADDSGQWVTKGRPLDAEGRPKVTAGLWLINSGLLDELPALKVQVSHFAGGIGRYLPRIRGLQQREKSGTATIPRHGRQPRKPFDHYLRNRLFYDCAGWSGPDYAAERGAEWVRIGMAELPVSQLVFATDYPQAVRDDDEIVAYVKAVGGLGSEARKILDGANAEKLIPNLKERAETYQQRPPAQVDESVIT